MGMETLNILGSSTTKEKNEFFNLLCKYKQKPLTHAVGMLT